MSQKELEIDRQYQQSVPFLKDEYRVHKNATVSSLMELGLESFEVIDAKHKILPVLFQTVTETHAVPFPCSTCCYV